MVKMPLMDRSDCKGAKVFYRFLPMYHVNWENVKVLEDRKSIYIRCLQDFAAGREHNEPSYWQFVTDGIFYNNNQSEIYDVVFGDGIFQKVLEGNNALFLSFGQTGSGKTTTTTGLTNLFEDRGFIPRTIETVYNLIENLKKCKVRVQIKYVETSRNYAMDLLGGNDDIYDANSLDKITVLNVKSRIALMKKVFQAEARKTFRRSGYYSSNMANSIFTMIITIRTKTETTVGKIHIVDLCGSDTVGNYSCYHKHGLEVGVGNLARTELEQFILVLNRLDTSKALMNQRLSIIIYYLRDVLNTHSFLRFVGHVRLSMYDMRVTLSLFRFGSLLRKFVPQKLNPNIFRDRECQINVLEKEILAMKKETDLNSMLKNEDLRTNLSQDRYDYIKKLTDDYLYDKNGEIPILSASDAMMTMKIFKETYERVEHERQFLLQQLKIQDDSSNSLKQRDSISSSKNSKRGSIKANNSSTVSLNRSKRGIARKRTSRDSKKDMGSIAESSSRNLRTGSKAYRKKQGGKRRSCDSSVQKSETSMAGTAGMQKPIDELPAHSDAWLAFTIDDPFYKVLQEELVKYEKEMKEINLVYVEQVKKLHDVNELRSLRKDELFRAYLIKDMDEIDSEGSLVYTELELKCMENLRLIEQQVVHQKERMLKLHAEMRIAIEGQKCLKSDIDKRYEEFCRLKYNVEVPDLSLEQDGALEVQLDETCLDPDEQKTNRENKSNEVAFNEMREYMKREYEKCARIRYKNQQWIRSCKSLHT